MADYPMLTPAERAGVMHVFDLTLTENGRDVAAALISGQGPPERIAIQIIWFISLLHNATQDMYGTDLRPSQRQVFELAQRAHKRFAPTFPGPTPGVLADVTEYALGGLPQLPALVNPLAVLTSAIMMTAFIMGMHEDRAMARIAEILDKMTADLDD